MSVLAVRSTPFEIAKNDPDADTQVAAIGHPFPDEDRNPDFIRIGFGAYLYVKRVSAGEVTAGRSAEDDGTFDHDCSTLGGNSGSPIISLETGRVAGVHREGFFLERNVAVGAECPVMPCL